MSKMNWLMANKRYRMNKYGSINVRDCFLHTSPPSTIKKEGNTYKKEVEKK